MEEKSGFREQMPQTIGRYQVQESVGYGAMGAVYKAFDPLIKRTLAIKTIRLDIPRQSPQYKSFIERFYHEARISGTLSHPNIVTLFDIGEEGGIPYLAMEFVEGETISSLIERGVRFNPEKVIGLISQIASAVDYAHSKGVIHRDIKPSNLILSDGERVKVTDFGIAKLVDAEMTQSGTLLGTPSYMSPEQAMGDKLDGRSDIFSLGVCAFEMLAGEQPFPGNNVTSILYKLVHVDPIEPANLEMNGLVPQKWYEVFGRVLAKKPDDRYQTATDFVQDLEYCLGAWFGAAMGEDPTLASGRSAPPVDGATNVLPVHAESSPKPSSLREAPAPPSPSFEPEPSTVNLGARVEDPADGVTRALEVKGLSSRAAALSEKTEKVERPSVPDSTPPAATIMLKRPSGAAPVAPAPASPAAAPPGGSAVFTTVVMSADQLAAQARSTAKGSQPAPAAPPEATVVMSSAELARAADRTARSASGPTEASNVPTARQATIPPGARRAASLPKTGPTPRPPIPVPPGPATAPAEPAGSPGALAFVAGLPAAVLLGAAAVMFLLAAGIVIMLVLGGRSGSVSPAAVPVATPDTAVASPVPTEVPPQPVGRLLVESQPPGADVTVNGDYRGITPLDLAALPFGDYEVRMELKGFEPRTQSVLLTADAPESQVKASLSRLGPALGSAEILSNPVGATVSVDGREVGVTPLPAYRLRPGSYRVDVAKDGYETWSGSVVVASGAKGSVNAQLRPVPTPAPTAVPTPAVDVPDPSRVFQENELDGTVRKVSGPGASYPKAVPPLRSGESRSVSVSFVVLESGEPSEVKIIESGDNQILDEAVVSMIEESRFAPPTKGGVKVKARLLRKFTFRAG